MTEPVVAEAKTEEAKTETVLTEPVKVAEVKTEPAKVVEAAKPTVPEKYELKIPEKSTLTQKDADLLSAQAKEKGWSQEQAQTVWDARNDSATKAVSDYQAREVERIKGEAPKWLEQLKADKEIGGEKLNESIENAKRVITKYADAEFKEFLNTSGLGNHPMVARIFAKIGKAFGESHWVEGNPIAPKKDESPASKLYDKTPTK